MTPPFADPVRHDAPFPYLTSERVLGRDVAEALRAAFDDDLAWVRHDSFYHAWMADLTDRVDPGLAAALVARLGPLLGLPLTDRVTATAQRMDPGDHALAHTDRPLVGFEAARLVVQLNLGWGDDDGGAFVALADADGREEVRRHAPRFDTGVAFVMTPTSHHAVLPSRRERRTVVLHFWHAGNTDAVAALVADLFDALDLGALPGALDPVAAEAEARLPEDVTWRALLAAWALRRWGFDADDVVAGYRASLGAPAPDALRDAAALAGWVARLRVADFDPSAWADLAASLGPDDDPRLAPARRILVPVSG